MKKLKKIANCPFHRVRFHAPKVQNGRLNWLLLRESINSPSAFFQFYEFLMLMRLRSNWIMHTWLNKSHMLSSECMQSCIRIDKIFVLSSHSNVKSVWIRLLLIWKYVLNSQKIHFNLSREFIFNFSCFSSTWSQLQSIYSLKKGLLFIDIQPFFLNIYLIFLSFSHLFLGLLVFKDNLGHRLKAVWCAERRENVNKFSLLASRRILCAEWNVYPN